MTSRADPRKEPNGTKRIPPGLTAEEYAHLSAEAAAESANHLLANSQELGSMARELSEVKEDVAEGFEALGVKLRRARKKLASLSDEIEDTKTRHLRAELSAAKKKIAATEAAKTDWRTWALRLAIGAALTGAGALTMFVLQHLFH